MRKRKVRRTFGALAAGLPLVLTQVHAERSGSNSPVGTLYSITRLTLPGDNNSYVTSLDSKGDAAGNSGSDEVDCNHPEQSAGFHRAFLYSASSHQMKEIPPPRSYPSSESVAQGGRLALNVANECVSETVENGSYIGERTGRRYRYRLIAHDFRANAISPHGLVAGRQITSPTRSVASVATPSPVGYKVRTLLSSNGLGDSLSSAYSIDEDGRTVGSQDIPGQSFATVWTRNRKPILLGNDAIGPLSYAFGVAEGLPGGAERIKVVGYACSPCHPLVWNGRAGGEGQQLNFRRPHDLGIPPAFAEAAARAISPNGKVIVGWAATAPDGPADAAFVWEDGRRVNLNKVVVSGSRWQLIEATGVNNRGQIVGQGWYRGHFQAFLLSPL